MFEEKLNGYSKEVEAFRKKEVMFISYNMFYPLYNNSNLTIVFLQAFIYFQV